MIGTYYGKDIEAMDKDELLKVIEFLITEMLRYKQQAEATSDQFNNYRTPQKNY